MPLPPSSPQRGTRSLRLVTFDNFDLFSNTLNVADPILSVPREVLFLLIESPLQSASVHASRCSGSYFRRCLRMATHLLYARLSPSPSLASLFVAVQARLDYRNRHWFTLVVAETQDIPERFLVMRHEEVSAGQVETRSFQGDSIQPMKWNCFLKSKFGSSRTVMRSSSCYGAPESRWKAETQPRWPHDWSRFSPSWWCSLLWSSCSGTESRLRPTPSHRSRSRPSRADRAFVW